MAIVALTRENFESVVADRELVIVDFWAAWCAPCRAFAPTYEAVSEQHPDLVFGKVDTESQHELAAAFGIRSIPTLMVFREKVILYAEAGALPPAVLEEVIAKARGVDMAEVHREIAAAQAGADR